MKHLFYNTGSIIGFILKKDKIKILIWIIALIAYGVGFVPVFQGILDTSSNSQVLVDTMKNPAMIAMIGPVFVEDSYTIGSIYANYMMVFSALIAGAMNIFIVSSNTRKDEELGRTELLRALPVGRLSNLSASLTIAFFANLILLLATAIGMYFISPEIYLKGAIIFSAGIYGYGFLFACIVSLLGEIFTSNRAVMGAGFFPLIFKLYFKSSRRRFDGSIVFSFSPWSCHKNRKLRQRLYMALLDFAPRNNPSCTSFIFLCQKQGSRQRSHS